MLEEMAAFFEARLDGYDEHMLTDIESSREFYPFTARQLPPEANAHVLDLGCGTGLELAYYFQLNPDVSITGIDLSEGMLNALKSKFPDKTLRLIQGSYFDVPFPQEAYDAAVSVESLHHFTQDEKIPLYQKLQASLKHNGYLILTDYFAPDDQKEMLYRSDLLRLKKELGLDDENFYHYDTPLTVAHEKEALFKAGFSQVTELGSWGNTHTLKAIK